MSANVTSHIPSLFTSCLRWYGPQDPVGLNAIRQAGATGVVTALHQIPVGDVWKWEDIQYRKQMIEQNTDTDRSLKWEVVESLPVHDAIKRGASDRDKYIEQYCESLSNLGKCGIRVVCYNFMPVLDWLRTDLTYQMPDGARTLQFEYELLVVFDRYILKRANAEADYSQASWEAAAKRYEQMKPESLTALRNTILLGLPGDAENFTLEGLRLGIEKYRATSETQLRENLLYFLKQIVPVAEEAGVSMAIHPDDPPFSVLGLPRIVGSRSDIDTILEGVSSPANGLTFCTGSLGASAENNLVEMAQKWESRIHFLHLRSVVKWDHHNFREAPHLAGDANMYEVVRTLWQQRNQRLSYNSAEFSLPMRPDHGMQMLDDLDKAFYPGYSAIGRLRGLAELRGLELAISRSLL